MSAVERSAEMHTGFYRYPIEHKETEPRSNNAILFPGQAIQEVGMGMSFEKDPAAKEVYTRADKLISNEFGFDLTHLMFNGPETDLLRTSITQPAVLTYSVALHNANRHHKKEGFATIPRFVTGHSMGMITAVVLSGGLSFEEGLFLAGKRGQLMEQKGSKIKTGMLTTINGNEETVREILHDNPSLDLCLVNADNRFVVGGPVESLENAASEFKAARIKTIPVATDRAMHSRYISEAKPDFEKVLMSLNIKNPLVPIIGSHGQILHNREEIIQDQLEQFDHTFDFRKIKDFFEKNDIKLVSEVNEKGTFTKILAGTLGGAALAAATGVGIYEWHKHHPNPQEDKKS